MTTYYPPSERVFTKTWHLPDSHSLATYQANGGYAALSKALSMSVEAITQEVTDSNLRGRGGAGFPVGKKWSFVPKDSSKPRYLCINGDESEPGTFKDRYILERSPHMLLEGCVIAAKAIGARKCYIYVRGEFGLAVSRLEAAISEAYANRLVGQDILGSGSGVDIFVHRGAGAYICGEETALLESIEGKKGQPRLKPPFPAVEGLFHCPTIINNVESIAAVPAIIQKGASWWKSLSLSTAEGGTKLVGVSGHALRPGVYELPIGLTLRQIIYDVAGGMRDPKRPLKAVIPGGSSCPIVRADQIDVQFDFDNMKKVQSLMGTGCPTVIEEGTCMVRLLRRILRFYAHESCGQCTPCREGGDWLFKIVDRIEEGRGREADLMMLESVASKIEGHTICPFGEALSWPTRSYAKQFADEFREHVRQKRCPFGSINVEPVMMAGDAA